MIYLINYVFQNETNNVNLKVFHMTTGITISCDCKLDLMLKYGT